MGFADVQREYFSLTSFVDVALGSIGTRSSKANAFAAGLALILDIGGYPYTPKGSWNCSSKNLQYYTVVPDSWLHSFRVWRITPRTSLARARVLRFRAQGLSPGFVTRAVAFEHGENLLSLTMSWTFTAFTSGGHLCPCTGCATRLQV